MDPNMGGDVGEMIVKRVSVPIGLEELMEGLVKEVLLTKPDDIYIFAAKYFSQLLTHRDRSQHKAKTMRSAQSLKGHQGEKRFSTKIPVQAVTKHLSRQFSIREESANKNLESPIISQKPRMYNRSELKYKRKDNGPQTIKENQSLAARKQLSRSVSNERSREGIGSYIRKEPKKTNSPRGLLKNKSGPKRGDIRNHITGLPSVEVEEADKSNVENGKNESKPPMVLDVKAKPVFSANVSGISADNSQEGSGKTNDISMGNSEDITHESIESTIAAMKPDRKEEKTKENSEWQLGDQSSTYETPQEQIVEGSDEKPEAVNINDATIKTAERETSLRGNEVLMNAETKTAEEAIKEKSDPSSLEKNNEPDVPHTEEIKEDPISTNSSQSDALDQIAQEKMKEKDVQKPEDDKNETRLDDSSSSGKNTHEALEGKKNNGLDAPLTKETKENPAQEEMEENGVRNPKDDKKETSVDDSVIPDKSTHHEAIGEEEDLSSLEKNNVPDAHHLEEINEDPISSNSSQSDGLGKIAPDKMKESDVQELEDNIKDTRVDDSVTPDKSTQEARVEENNLNNLEKNNVPSAKHPEEIKEDLISSNSSQSDGSGKIAPDKMKESDVQEPEDNMKETRMDDSVTPDKSTQEAIVEENNLNNLEKNNVPNAKHPEELKEDPISSNSSQSDGSGKIAPDKMKESDVQETEDNIQETRVDDSVTPDKSTQEAIVKENDLNNLEKNNVSNAKHPEELKEDPISSNSSQSDGSGKIAPDKMKESDVQEPEDNIKKTRVDDSVTPDKSTQETIVEEKDLSSLGKNNVPDAPHPEQIKEDPISTNSGQPDALGQIGQQDIKEKVEISRNESSTTDKHAQEGKRVETDRNSLGKDDLSDLSTIEGIKQDDKPNEKYEKTHVSKEKPKTETQTSGENERDLNSKGESKPKVFFDSTKSYQKETEKTGDTNMLKDGDDGQLDNHLNLSQTSTLADAKEEDTSEIEEPKKLIIDKVSTLNSPFVDNAVEDEPNNEVMKKVDLSESNSLEENKSKSTIPDEEESADSPVKDCDSEISNRKAAVEKETKESEKPVETSREKEMKSNQFEFLSSSEDGTNISQEEQVVHENSTTLSSVKNQQDSPKEISNSNEISGVSGENIEEHATDIKKRENIADQIGDTKQDAMQSEIVTKIHNNQNEDTNENGEKEDINNKNISSLGKSNKDERIGVEVSVSEDNEGDVDSHKTDSLKNETNIIESENDYSGGEGKSTEIGSDSSSASKDHEIHKLSTEDNIEKTVKVEDKETFSINEKNKIFIEKEKQASTSIKENPTGSTINSNTAETEDNKVNESDYSTSREYETQNIKTDDNKKINENSVLSNSPSKDDIQSSIERIGSKETGDAKTDDQTEETSRDSSVIEHTSVVTMEKSTPPINRQTDNSTDIRNGVFDARDDNSMEINSPPGMSQEKILANEEPFVKKMVTHLGDRKSSDESFVSEIHGSSSDSTKKEMNETSENSVEDVSPNGNVDENRIPLDGIRKSSMDDEQSLVDTRSKMSQEPEESVSKTKSSGIVDRVAKNYVNYVIDKEKNALPENENPHNENETEETSSKTVQPSEVSEVKGSFDGSKLREELQKVEEESKFTSFKPAFNPSQLRQEIQNASLHKTLPNETEVYHNLAQAAAVLRIQSMWRGFKVRKSVSKPNTIQLKDENSNVLKKNNQVAPVAHESPDDILQAVITIQRFWRGYKTRRGLKKMHFLGKRVADGNNYSDTMLAAVTIQKMWRGFKTRNLLRMQHPTKDHRPATIDETREHPEMNTLLDEILDYPVREEHHLIDTYQNKLLDKISGKNDDSNEDLEVYKALTSKRIEELKSEEGRDLSSVHTTLLSKPHGVKPKLESLAEEPTDDKLYTFCSAPLPIPGDSKIVGESLDYIRNKDVKGDTPILLHSGELHDSLVLPLSKGLTRKPDGDGTVSVPAKDEGGITKMLSNAALLHSGELHDSIVLPLTIGKTGNVSEARVGEVSSGSSAALPVVSVNFENNALPVGVQILQAPAALGAVTSRRADPAQARQPTPPTAIASETMLSASRRPSMVSDEGDETTAQRGVSMESEAARKIQAGFRGYQVRKQLKLKNGSSDMSISNSRRQTRPKMSQKESPKSQSKPKEIEEKSAVKIQAGVRGFLVRRRQKKQINQ